MACAHPGQYHHMLTVDRQVSGQTVTFKATAMISCSDCGVAFLFNGLATASALSAITGTPACSTDKKALFAPIAPSAVVACTHVGRFRPEFTVSRTVSGQTVTFKVALAAACSTCSTAFVFNGLTTASGLTAITSSPATSADKRQIFVPIAPAA